MNQTNPILDEYNNLSSGLKATLAQTGASLASQAGGVTGGTAPSASTVAPKFPPIPMPSQAQQRQSSLLPASAPKASLFSTPTPQVGRDVPSLFGGTSAPTTQVPVQIVPPKKAGPSLPDLNPQAQRDADELARKINTGSGISQISGKIQGLMPNHPTIGKLLGGAAQGLATLGDVGLRAVAPSVDIALPGTSLHHQAEIHQGQKLLAQDFANQRSAAEMGAENAQAEEANTRTGLMPQAEARQQGVANSEIAEHDAQTYKLLHPTATNEFELWQQQNPNGTPQDFENLQKQPISAEDAAARNAVWDSIADRYHLPKGQFREGMSAADAQALSAAMNSVIGLQQDAQSLGIRQERVAQTKAQTFTDGGKTYNIPPNEVQEFLRDHPNAR